MKWIPSDGFAKILQFVIFINNPIKLLKSKAAKKGPWTPT